MPYLLLILTTLFWAGNFVIGRAMHSVLPPIVMAELRWTLALVILLPFLIPRLIKHKAVIITHWKMLTVFAIFSVACFNTFIYIGLTSTNASNATILQSAIPIFILILSAVWLKEPVSIQQWIGVTISLVGVLMLITQGQISNLLSLSFNVGDLYVLTGVLCWAIYSLLLRWRPAELDGFTFFGVTVLIGSLILLPFSAVEFYFAEHIVWGSKSTYAVLYMAIFPSILAYIFWNKGVADIGAVKAGLFIHLMPLFGLLLSSIFLNEQIHTFHLIGILFIFSGIYLAIKAKLAK
ncbi:DMT family transporter [Colwellia sp. 20A7]|uniref:DMT family transporter n=1 Tax=Colwellia sp. 20A7 TaxID=2689569 RepID=UPI00135876FF|nr:DMT family transporter [Colwellia sp. 20A7]